jgi:hypothetical protein
MAAAAWRVQSGATLADIQAISEVLSLYVADPAWLYSDGGTTNVAGDGDPIQEWHCANGSGETLSLVGSGVTYRTDGTRHWVESDGNGRLEKRFRHPDADPPFFLGASGRQTTEDTTFLMFYGNENVDKKYADLRLDNADSSSGSYAISEWGNSGFSGNNGYAIGEDHVLSIRVDGDTFARIDGTEYAGAGQVYGGNDSKDRLSVLGRGKQTPDNSPGRIYAAVVTDAVPSTTDIDTIEQWLATRAGVSL